MTKGTDEDADLHELYKKHILEWHVKVGTAMMRNYMDQEPTKEHSQKAPRTAPEGEILDPPTYNDVLPHTPESLKQPAAPPPFSKDATARADDSANPSATKATEDNPVRNTQKTAPSSSPTASLDSSKKNLVETMKTMSSEASSESDSDCESHIK